MSKRCDFIIFYLFIAIKMKSKYGSEQNSPYEDCTTISNGCMLKKQFYVHLRKKVLGNFFCTSGFRRVYKELKLVACGQG